MSIAKTYNLKHFWGNNNNGGAAPETANTIDGEKKPGAVRWYHWLKVNDEEI